MQRYNYKRFFNERVCASLQQSKKLSIQDQTALKAGNFMGSVKLYKIICLLQRCSKRSLQAPFIR